MNNREAVVRSFGTVIEMLQDRKVDLGGFAKDSISEILEPFLSSNKTLFEITINDIKVIYCLSAKLKWSELRKFFEDDEEYQLYICIVKDKMSQNNAKMLNALKLNLQVFDIRHLQFNISHHHLVPKHEIVNDEEEIKQLIENLCIKNKFQLPIILKSDAMAKYLGLRNGDIVRITRPSPTSGQYVSYRCCV